MQCYGRAIRTIANYLICIEERYINGRSAVQCVALLWGTEQYSISHLTSQNLSVRHEILMNIAQYNF